MELKEVLHFYLGSDYRVSYVETPNTFTVWSKLTAKRLINLDDLSIHKIELSLRPLSDMTEEDTHNIADELGIITSNVFAWRNSALAGGLTHFSTQVEFINACRKRGYDCDGLINSNQAIDKTKGE